ncbi:MAG: hypothetical protein GDA51_13570 [Ekhidna sp.]|nr:hypothetical protein [Ekhidna sp.]
MSGRSGIGMRGNLRSVTPFYGVVVSFPADGRNGNGFVGFCCLPCGDEGFGFRFGLCLPVESE